MATPVVETHDLTKHYGATVGVEGLDLVVEEGEVLGFLGPNGAGKTTSIRLLLDLIRPTRGTARLFGRPSTDPAARSSVGYLPGELSMDDRLTGRRMLELLDAVRPRDLPPSDPRRREMLCERLHLPAADLDRPLRDDSRGTKQKIGLVAAMQHDPALLILDEPTTGLDPLVREEVLELLREAGEAGKTVFHSSHVLSEVDRSCTRVAVVRAGRLVALADIDDLRASVARRMVVRFHGEVPGAELAVPGVTLLEQDGDRAVLSVSGPLDPLLAVLARHRVRHLSFPEPDLEEAFVQYYAAAPAVNP
jgi:ABC-2 type transport system ATP-binding protein